FPPIRTLLVAGLRGQDLPAGSDPEKIPGSLRLSMPAHLGPASPQRQPRNRSVRRPEIRVIRRQVLPLPFALRPRSLRLGPRPTLLLVGGQASPRARVKVACPQARWPGSRPR